MVRDNRKSRSGAPSFPSAPSVTRCVCSSFISFAHKRGGCRRGWPRTLPCFTLRTYFARAGIQRKETHWGGHRRRRDSLWNASITYTTSALKKTFVGRIGREFPCSPSFCTKGTNSKIHKNSVMLIRMHRPPRVRNCPQVAAPTAFH